MTERTPPLQIQFHGMRLVEARGVWFCDLCGCLLILEDDGADRFVYVGETYAHGEDCACHRLPEPGEYMDEDTPDDA